MHQNSTPFESRLEDKLCFDCAGASRSRVGPSGKTQKKREKTFDGPVFGFVGFEMTLDAVLNVSLDVKMHPKYYCASLWAP